MQRDVIRRKHDACIISDQSSRWICNKGRSSKTAVKGDIAGKFREKMSICCFQGTLKSSFNKIKKIELCLFWWFFVFIAVFFSNQISMSALVTRVWTVELALTEWMGSRVAVYRDSVDHSVKQVSIYEMTWLLPNSHHLGFTILSFSKDNSFEVHNVQRDVIRLKHDACVISDQSPRYMCHNVGSNKIAEKGDIAGKFRKKNCPYAVFKEHYNRIRK